MKVILDTNVFVSGVFFGGLPAQILEAWRNGHIQLVLSAEILEEYQRVGQILRNQYPGVDLAGETRHRDLSCASLRPSEQLIHEHKTLATVFHRQDECARFARVEFWKNIRAGGSSRYLDPPCPDRGREIPRARKLLSGHDIVAHRCGHSDGAEEPAQQVEGARRGEPDQRLALAATSLFAMPRSPAHPGARRQPFPAPRERRAARRAG